jgi:nicotinamidase-related amidase
MFTLGERTMKQALIVIDVQESFRRRAYFREEELPAFLRNLQSLIDQARSRDIPIVQVFHRELPDDATNPFSVASGQVRAMPEVALRADVVIYKQVHSALFGTTPDGSTLEQWLRWRGIGELLITGIRTEQCCETTTRHASDLGFSVRYITDATLTFPMRTRGGREVTAAEIRERTEMVLHDRFAQVVSSATALG